LEALGAEHVTGIAMRRSSRPQGSIDDARALAHEPRHTAFHVTPIDPIYQPYESAIDDLFGEQSSTSQTRTCRRASAATS